jgi:hypothetical protein
MILPQERICGVGLQAVLPDGILMAVAAARPSTSSALMSCAQGSLDALHRDGAQQQQGAAVWLRRHASEVSNLHACITACISFFYMK